MSSSSFAGRILRHASYQHKFRIVDVAMCHATRAPMLIYTPIGQGKETLGNWVRPPSDFESPLWMTCDDGPMLALGPAAMSSSHTFAHSQFFPQCSMRDSHDQVPRLCKQIAQLSSRLYMIRIHM